MSDLVLVHLYPRLLRTYGDRGNVLVLARRAEWRGFSVRIDEVDLGDPLPEDAGLVLLGGGTDRVQEIIGADLAAKHGQLEAAAARGSVILGICGGYQFLGRRYVTPEGRSIDGLSMLDVETHASERRIIGRVHARATLWGSTFDLAGFENHGGRTTLGPAAAPLAVVPRGDGNDGRTGTEGAVQGTIVGDPGEPGVRRHAAGSRAAARHRGRPARAARRRGRAPGPPGGPATPAGPPGRRAGRAHRQKPALRTIASGPSDRSSCRGTARGDFRWSIRCSASAASRCSSS